MTREFLSISGLSKRFGAVQALRGVSFDLQAGEIRAICGENGAGKSTLVKLLMGIHEPDEGEIRIDGSPVRIAGPQQAQRLGLGLVAQELSLAPHLSVVDNILLGDEDVPFFYRRRALRDKAVRALELLGADIDLDRAVSELTVGQRQLVEIARLMSRKSRLLILDEPTATLSDVEIERMFRVLRNLRAEGRSILYITHRLGEVFDICDSVTVLRNGMHISTGPVAATDRKNLIEMMLGRSFSDMYPKSAQSVAVRGCLDVEGLAIPGILAPLSFSAPRGKIVALAGQIGSGATQASRAIAGLVPEAAGRVSIDGVPVSIRSPGAARRAQINFVSEDRAVEGLFHRNVLENFIALRLPDFTSFGVLSWSGLKALARDLAKKVNVDSNRLYASAFDLSGGNQQKILFGRAAGQTTPGVLVLNEPTRGVDVGARAEIYGMMRDFCRQGYAIVMTSSDLEEVAGMADIVVTLYRGHFVNRYEGDQIRISSILSDITHPSPQTDCAA